MTTGINDYVKTACLREKVRLSLYVYTFITNSGLKEPIPAIPIPAFEVPQAAPIAKSKKECQCRIVIDTSRELTAKGHLTRFYVN